ncbi:MAG: hypothetical protein ACON35_02195 [Candidatus Marinamargulisbacteria bacterium]
MKKIIATGVATDVFLTIFNPKTYGWDFLDFFSFKDISAFVQSNKGVYQQWTELLEEGENKKNVQNDFYHFFNSFDRVVKPFTLNFLNDEKSQLTDIITKLENCSLATLSNSFEEIGRMRSRNIRMPHMLLFHSKNRFPIYKDIRSKIINILISLDKRKPNLNFKEKFYSSKNTFNKIRTFTKKIDAIQDDLKKIHSGELRKENLLKPSRKVVDLVKYAKDISKFMLKPNALLDGLFLATIYAPDLLLKLNQGDALDYVYDGTNIYFYKIDHTNKKAVALKYNFKCNTIDIGETFPDFATANLDVNENEIGFRRNYFLGRRLFKGALFHFTGYKEIGFYRKENFIPSFGPDGKENADSNEFEDIPDTPNIFNESSSGFDDLPEDQRALLLTSLPMDQGVMSTIFNEEDDSFYRNHTYSLLDQVHSRSGEASSKNSNDSAPSHFRKSVENGLSSSDDHSFKRPLKRSSKGKYFASVSDHLSGQSYSKSGESSSKNSNDSGPSHFRTSVEGAARSSIDNSFNRPFKRSRNGNSFATFSDDLGLGYSRSGEASSVICNAPGPSHAGRSVENGLSSSDDHSFKPPFKRKRSRKGESSATGS